MLDKESQMRNVGTSLSQATEGQQLTNRNEDQKCTQGGESKTAGSFHLFAHAAEGSDAGARFCVRLSRIPPWEIQQECTDELIGQDLV